jgi:hypothetical protein
VVRREADVFASGPALLALLHALAKDDSLAELRTTYQQSWHLIHSVWLALLSRPQTAVT